jgi:redox-sensitive bicupin YhaK (pirin superfamily)
MSAGTGLTHSEFNLAEKPVHFYQIWIFPDQAELKPTYDQRNFTPDQWKNRMLPVASGQNVPDTVTFHTDATIYRAALNSGKKLSFEKTAERRIFIYLTSGQLEVNGITLEAKDQARIDEDMPLAIQAKKDAEFILIDVPSCKGWGYSEKTLHGASR